MALCNKIRGYLVDFCNQIRKKEVWAVEELVAEVYFSSAESGIQCLWRISSELFSVISKENYIFFN